MRFFLKNLRGRLLALLTLATVPAIVFATYNIITEYRASNQRMERDILHMSQLADEKCTRLIEDAQQLIGVLGNTRSSAKLSTVFRSFMDNIGAHKPHYTNVVVVGPTGQETWSALPLSNPGNQGDLPWFKRAVEAKGVIVGDFWEASATRRTGLFVAGPVYDEAGNLSAVIGIGMDVEWFEALSSRLRTPGAAFVLLDEKGSVLARHPGSTLPGDDAATGENPFPPSSEVQTILDTDGIERVYTTRSLGTKLPQGGLYLGIGAPTSIFAEARRHLVRCLVLLATVVIFTFFTMIIGSRALILDKVDTLIETARQLRGGNLGVRTGLPNDGDELGQLAAAFDQMVESLELQELVRKRSQAALAASEQRFRTIFDCVNDAILVLNHFTGAILDVNQTMCELFGYTREEALRLSIADFSSGSPPYTQDGFMEWIANALDDGPQLFEWHARRRSARELFWCEVNMRAAMIGGRKRILVTLRDVTERKESEIALRESEARYRAFIVNSTEGIFRLELRKPISVHLPVEEQVRLMLKDAYLAECNDMMARIYGMRAAEHILGQNLADVLPRVDSRNLDHLRSFVFSGYRLTDVEFSYKGSGGRKLYLLNSLFGVVENEMLVRAWGVQRDITAQKQADEDLRFLSQFNQEIISNATHGIIVYDKDLNFLVWNKFMEELTGLAATDVLGKKPLEIFPHLLEYGIDALFDRARAGAGCCSCDMHFTVPQTGKEVWMFSTFGPHFDPDGNIIGVIEIATDIQSRKQAEDELERLSRQRQLILDAADEAIVGLDLDGRIIFANPACTQILGYSTDELLGQDLHALIHHTRSNGSPYGVEDCPIRATITTGLPLRSQGATLWRKDAAQFPAVYSSAPIVEAGRISGAVVTFKDVTAQKSAEETRTRLEGQLRQAQKLEAIGTLAGGIAHDFNNILTPIMGYCQLALAETDPESILHRQIAQVFQSSIRARDLVRQILAFSRKGEPQRKPVQVSPIVKEALDFMRSSLPSTLEIHHEIDPDAARCSVMADPTQLHQIIMNLCTNAAHAVGEHGGTVSVKLRLTAVSTDAEHPNIKPGTYLKLSVSDTGCGMDETVLQRIYEPYFTTKSASEGTGLGLSVVYGIVNTLRGTIAVRSKPGKGTTFTILLPQAEADELGMPDPMSDAPSGSGRILLVDDEKSVLDLEKEVLEQMGYSVTARYSSLDALEAFQSNPWKFDLVMSDQTMPQMTGIELAKEMLKIRPDIPIVLCTGMIETAYKERALKAGVKAFLLKPLILQELANTLQELLRIDDDASGVVRAMCITPRC